MKMGCERQHVDAADVLRVDGYAPSERTQMKAQNE